MTSISSIETVKGNGQPSHSDATPTKHRPRSPSDVAGDLGEDYDEPPPPSQWKGKQRESYEMEEDSDSQHTAELSSAYPPTTDEDAESKRVAEHLRQWEIAERQRRKATRESASGGPSLVSNVARRASLLWKNNGSERRHSQPPKFSHDHTKLQSQESLALDSTPTSPATASFAATTNTPATQDPFADPPLSPAESRLGQPPPPPQPINLPPPKTPPPRLSVSAPEEEMAQQQRSLPQQQQPEQPPKRARWWHEMLCGCGEGEPGDHQAGRTNPFE